jgi:hypothetical protein
VKKEVGPSKMKRMEKMEMRDKKNYLYHYLAVVVVRICSSSFSFSPH